MTSDIQPQFGGLIKLGAEGGFDSVPDVPQPYYFGAKDGLYLHKRMLIGRGAVRQQTWPENFPELGHPNGAFDFDAKPIPKELMAQVVDFFTTVYDRQHTEAAVLLTMHAETKEWRIFVPTQLLSHGGVNYVFEPTHIRYPWVLVGSIHSHCDFGAGHSGTDTNDADGFDGIHMTIGNLKRQDPPMIVAMVAMNKKLFHYKPEQFPELFDFSDVRCAKAPDWWYRYTENTIEKTKPVGFELYAKYDRPTVVKQEKAPTSIKKLGPTSPNYAQSQFRSDDWYYHAELHRMVHKSWVINDDKSISYPDREQALIGRGQHGLTVVRRPDYIEGIGYAAAPRPKYTADDWDEFYRLLGVEEEPESFKGTSPEELLAQGYSFDPEEKTWFWTGGASDIKTIAARGATWGKDGELLIRPASQDELEQLGLKEQGDEYWEDSLPERFVSDLIEANLVTDDDLDYAVQNPSKAGTMEFWQHLILRKAMTACQLLQDMNVEAKVHVKMPKTPPKDVSPELLPVDGAKPQQHQPGVH